MKRFFLIALLLSLPCVGGATTRYIAQTAGVFSGGTNCNGHTAITPATFSGVTNAAGDINYLCGTITGGANSTPITVGGNGSSGNPVQIIWDTGAILQAPYCNTSVGCINLNGSNWITLDGGTNGILQNTANGTSLANHQASRLIYNPGDNNTIKHLAMLNAYVHTNGDTGGDSAYVIYARGISNFHVGPGNTLSQADVCLLFLWDGGESNLTIDGNHFTGCNQDIEQGTSNTGVTSFTNVTVSNNTADNWVNWDDANNDYHHNFYHPFTNVPGSSLVGTLLIYNNRAIGDMGNHSTSMLFLENNNGGSGGTMGTWYVFNNIFEKTNANAPASSGIIAPMSNNGFAVNNTVKDAGGTGNNAYPCFDSYGTGWTFKNNIMIGCGVYNYVQGATEIADYNDYYGAASPLWKGPNSVERTTFSAWQTAIGGDAHAITTNPNLTSYIPNTGSPVINTGINLTSLGVTQLNSDIAGNARPSSGSWTMGAYNATSTPSPTSPTIGGKVVQGSATISH